MRSKVYVYIAAAITLWLYYFISFEIDRTDFFFFVGAYTLLFGLYFVFLSNSEVRLRELIVFAIIFRCIHLVAVPHLSDDFYRFLWDGLLTSKDVNPFDYTPSTAFEMGLVNKPVLLENMNSPEYYSVYPPINQAIFYISALALPFGLTWSLVVMRLFVIAAELGTMFFLLSIVDTFLGDRRKVMIYALNPLIILEFSHSLHFEVFMIFFLSGAIYMLTKNRNVFSALMFSGAVCVKIIPLMFLPLLLQRLGVRKFLVYSGIVVGSSVILFLPFYNEFFVNHISDSLLLYFETFEFNSSLASISKYLENHLWWFDSRLFSLLEMLLLASIFFKIETRTIKGFVVALLGVLTTYFLFTRSLHPWYITPLIMLSVFSKFRFPIIWSFLIGLTYITYLNAEYQQNTCVIILEYVIVFPIIILEVKALDKKYWVSINKFVRNARIFKN